MQLAGCNETFDLVVCKFILHHTEPFDEFSIILASLIKIEGRGIFIENSSRNKVLMNFRRHLVGKFGVPKLGDMEEHPFEPREIEILTHDFKAIQVHYAEFEFFRLLGLYIFKDNELFKKMDRWFYKNIPRVRPFIYRQIIELQKY